MMGRMGETDGSGGSLRRQLRATSMHRRPGRYREDDGRPITADRPIWAHPPRIFRADLAAHCAFPSLPLDYPGPGPSELVKAQTNDLSQSNEHRECSDDSSGDTESVSSDDVLDLGSIWSGAAQGMAS
ncbi:hypothetical protein N656DRAFT_326403 [Canariomyces notabilis]|uniref:Uncharacterized protein n=1 Tax=Canariomyces notabilis TaxID=2074819 RepID=A0AAN6QIT1_9PEZI|nr:hypothetical protein N656DRAFT_326403 [Canariomyces arenarius]